MHVFGFMLSSYSISQFDVAIFFETWDANKNFGGKEKVVQIFSQANSNKRWGTAILENMARKTINQGTNMSLSTQETLPSLDLKSFQGFQNKL